MDHSTTSGDGHARTVPDPRQFTHGLIYDVVKALEAHGYGPFEEGRQLVELGQHLIHFLHGRGDRCYGGPAVTVEPPYVEEPRAVTRKVAALHESGAAVDAAMARYDQRWGHEL
jgi:hypothetical protein